MSGPAVTNKKLPKYCHADTDRHLNTRIYFKRPGGRKLRIYAPPGTPAFWDAYNAACRGEATPKDVPPPENGLTPARHGTFGWLLQQYFARCFEYRDLEAESRRVRRRVLEGCLDEPTEPGAATLMRDCPLAKMTTVKIEMLRDRKAESPEAANSRLKYLSGVFKWAASKKGEPTFVRENIVQGVERFKTGSTGHHTLTWEEMAQYMTRHPLGTKAHLAFALFQHLGQRISDISQIGRQHVRILPRQMPDGTVVRWPHIHFTQVKNRRKKPMTLTLPIEVDLQRVLDATPCGELTFLVTDYGRPFSIKGLGQRMRKWFDEAGLPHCSSHGIRKGGATIAAENGATEAQLSALFGWRDPKMPAHYTRAARQKKLASDSMRLMPNGSYQEQNVPTASEMVEKWEQKARKA